MEEQELNKKLAEGAGIKHEEYTFNGLPVVLGEDIPDFTQSLDASFKWLVPKLTFWELIYNGYIGFCDAYVWAGEDDKLFGGAQAETPALALCLAIGKLISLEY